MYTCNLIEYYERTVVEHSDSISVVDGDRKLTFSQLDILVKWIASSIYARYGAVVRRPIAVFLDKSVETIASDIGIIYGGNAYMNLDTKLPKQRLVNTLNLVNPLCVLTDEVNASKLQGVWPSDCVIVLDFDAQEESDFDVAALRKCREGLIDTDPLCLINTSGSTGTPKSVVLNHRSFVDFTEWAVTTFDFESRAIIGSLSPAVFDIFSFELCLLMARGATIVVLPSSYAAFPAKILQIMHDEEVSFIFWVPTIMVNIANMGLLDQIELPMLRLVWFAGEVFPTKQFNVWYRSLPRTTFANLYGPIEITLDCTYYIVDREHSDNEPLPIGIPCRNTDVFLLNANDELAAPGEEGELCVRGSSLALGYYNNPEKTSAAFVQNPLNNSYPELIYRTGDIAYYNEYGQLIFKGRRDNLVKHSGYRIDLGEIEHVVVSVLKLAKNACVVYDHEKSEIVLFYESDKEIAPSNLRKSIGQAFPKYMIPTRFEHLVEMPRNTNGKIDRLELKNRLLADSK